MSTLSAEPVHTSTLGFQLVALGELSHNCFNSTGIHILSPFSSLILFVLSFYFNQAGKGISFPSCILKVFSKTLLLKFIFSFLIFLFVYFS